MAEIQDSSTLENFDSEAKSTGCQLSKKMILIIAIPVGIVVLLAIILGLVFGLKKKSSKEVNQDIFTPEYKTITTASYYSEIIGPVEPSKPVKEIRNEGSYKTYPKYGSTLREVIGNEPEKVEARNKIIEEANYLAAGGNQNYQYTWMDKDGKLYQGDVSNPIRSISKSLTKQTLLENEQRQLYKHTASIGLYLGDVLDNETRVIKKIYISKRSFLKCYSVTGLYAPAGEVIKVELSKSDMDATGGITFHIGQALNNGQVNNIWASKNQMQRWPILLNTMTINKKTAEYNITSDTYTGYIGSFIGGPIYIRATKVDFIVTISGGVVYPHFILGVTTPEMFNESLKSSAPYFDLEVWDLGVLHSGPRRYMSSFSYDDLYKAAVLWDKVASVTTYNNHQNIVFLYDVFVAAGAAVAFPGRSSVNCPASWMTSSLNYNSIVTVGTWGNFHEYHHNFQGYGVGNGGEVTNNALNLVSYALFTKISSNRKAGNYGAQGLDWWTSYTSSVYALNEVLKIKYANENPNNGNQGLGLYACLLHNFGPDCFIKVKGAGGGQSYLNYMNKWQDITHNNMYYYFNELLGGTGISNNADPNYSQFVPIACLYQTGRSYLYYNKETEKYEKKYFKSMRPYVIPYNETDIDLSIYTIIGGQYKSGSMYLPTNPDKSTRFEYKIKSLTQPKNGKINKIDDLHYKYVPDENQINLSSGEIYCTLEIKDKNNQLKVDDIDLILEFELTHETLKLTLDRTRYTYDPSKMYKDAREAYNNEFRNYEKVEKIYHSNPTQSCNTDIWYYVNTTENHNKYPNAPDHYFVQENQIDILDGKILFADNSKYRVYLRGRQNLAAYYSLDGKDYKLFAYINETYSNSAEFQLNRVNTYLDIEYIEGGKVVVTTYCNEGEPVTNEYKLSPDKNGDIRNWLFVKEVLIEKKINNNQASYTGLGYSEWIVATFSMSTTYLDQNGNVIIDDTDPNIKVIWTNYTNYQGKVVAKRKTFPDSTDVEYYNNNLESINQEDFTELTKEQILPPTSYPSYANAYRTTYDFPDNKAFESDYFYKRTYSETFTSDSLYYKTWDEGVSLVDTNFVAESDPYVIDNLFKEGYDNYIHPNRDTAKGTYFTIDMGKQISANSITFNGRTDKNPGTSMQGFPKEFSLYISNDNNQYTKIGDFINNDGNGNNVNRSVTVNFDKIYSFRYINITIESSHSNTGRVILSAIGFTYKLVLNKPSSGNLIIISSDDVVCTGHWENKLAYSKFGSVFVGRKDSRIRFEFTGNRLAAITSTKFGSNYQVNIDGNKVDSVQVPKLTNKQYGITYLTPKLSNQKHKVEIVCNGEANFDSFAYFIDEMTN